MNDPLLALALMVGGLGCIAAWGICRVFAEKRALRLRRESNAIKHHVVRGGSVPPGVSGALAEAYFQVHWIDVLASGFLGAGVGAAGVATYIVL